VIESPSFGTPTPTNGAPPLIELVVANPLADPGVFVEPAPGEEDPYAEPV
jgi:hypothetical protein